MIHQVAIKSLPQEWLWCETWCDDASKVRAKTIDLVSHNHPPLSCHLLPGQRRRAGAITGGSEFVVAARILTVVASTVISKMVLKRFNPAHFKQVGLWL